MSDSVHTFMREDGAVVPTVKLSALRGTLSEMWSRFALSPVQSVEAASFSYAMVVRFALGLSAQGGLICCVVRDSVPGAIALACLRHLTNAGAEAVVVVIEDGCPADNTEVFSQALQSITALGVKVENFKERDQLPVFEDICAACHNILFGTTPLIQNPNEDQQLLNALVELLNEQSTPVHTVLAPHGFCLETGNMNGELLYASSTLSLGAPLEAIGKNLDSVGRHYLADISLAPELYIKLSDEFPYLFHEQPVIKLVPYKKMEEENPGKENTEENLES